MADSCVKEVIAGDKKCRSIECWELETQKADSSQEPRDMPRRHLTSITYTWTGNLKQETAFLEAL